MLCPSACTVVNPVSIVTVTAHAAICIIAKAAAGRQLPSPPRYCGDNIRGERNNEHGQCHATESPNRVLGTIADHCEHHNGCHHKDRREDQRFCGEHRKLESWRQWIDE